LEIPFVNLDANGGWPIQLSGVGQHVLARDVEKKAQLKALLIQTMARGNLLFELHDQYSEDVPHA